jgi:hypothetical protein
VGELGRIGTYPSGSLADPEVRQAQRRVLGRWEAGPGRAS